MKILFNKYRSVIRFMVTFLLVYICLSVAYKFYLDFSEVSKFYPDYFTNLVAQQTQLLLGDLGYNAQVSPHPDEPSMKLIVNGKFLARIIEGCNGISVIILFVSFIIAFSGKLKTTFLYVFAGSVLLYVVNVLRIAILTMGIYHYPKQETFLHTVVFPGIIYGMVFLLWVFWVNRFSNLKKEND
ncbi:exosortase family protein XrtF [Mariniflexile ostreae]|uniref:Exosortase family protein XrtF n=1 Tax=Mariniflexile ostreae TaxID=1520892 RepID=A0ABV5FA99_9FLAO